MKKIVIFIFISLIFISGCGKENENENISYKTITSEEVFNMMENNLDVLILDVRSKEEYEAGHIANSINIPVNEIGNKFKEEVTEDLNKTILVYCRSGARAKQASELLVDLGYKNVIDFGGILNWNYGLVTD